MREWLREEKSILCLGDLVFHRIYKPDSKLDQKLETYSKIVEQIGQVLSVIWDQMFWKIKSVRANYLKLAELDDEEGPEYKK